MLLSVFASNHIFLLFQVSQNVHPSNIPPQVLVVGFMTLWVRLLLYICKCSQINILKSVHDKIVEFRNSQTNHAAVELYMEIASFTGPILDLRPANERLCYKLTLSLIDWAQTKNQLWYIHFEIWHRSPKDKVWGCRIVYVYAYIRMDY